MRIIALSDTHNEHESIKLPDGDILIYCGDATAKGTEPEIKSFCKWFSSQKFMHKIFIPGNHDFMFETNKYKALSYFYNVTYLDEDDVTLYGYKIYGSPITPKHGHSAFTRMRGEQMRMYWRYIPDNTDILITHAPPYGILDKSIKGTLCGCEHLYHKVKSIKPKYHLFGHIHNGHGHVFDGDTHFYNVAYLNSHSKKVTIIDVD